MRAIAPRVGGDRVRDGDMTLGETVTTTTPPAAPETSVTVPPVKAKP
jgi:hypothetical protein